MKKIHILTTTLLLALATSACKEQLDVKNPNQPTVGSAGTESGVTALAQGGVYQNGFREVSSNLYDGVPGYFWSGAVGFHELMGDLIGAEAANMYLNQIGAPDMVTLDDGTKVPNPNAPNTQIALIRQINQNSQQGQNPLFWEWWYMYSLNSAMNKVIDLTNTTTFAGDAATKKATLQAWAYWWKGYAYSRLGSIYYAGVINNATTSTNGNYVTKEALVTEGNANLDKAAGLLNGIKATDVYTTLMTQVIPSFNQTGKGNVPSPAEWVRSINTLKARNLLVNTRVKDMTAAQWQQLLTLTQAGVGATDDVFTGRTNANGDFLSPTAGTVAIKATGDPQGGATYKISERLIQDFRPGDARFTNNFSLRANQTPWIGNNDRGNSFNTRWQLLDGGKGASGVVVYSSRTPGGYEHYLASTYEENELMKAEALIYTGNISGGLASINAVRQSQGAGLATLSGLTQAQALEELRSERRVALAFRGLSFYDARRWGVLESGRTNAVVIDKAGKLNTKATINYNFLDYWDVPDNELKYNPAATGSAATKNPRTS